MSPRENAETPQALFTEFVSQGFIKQHKIKKVEMVITREAYNPFEYDKEIYSGIPGILTTYSFTPEGLLDSEGNGLSSTRTRYHYDENNEVVGQDFGSMTENYTPADVNLKNRMKWTSKGNLKRSMKLRITSACYGVNANYRFQIDNMQQPPIYGQSKFIEAAGERYAGTYPETLDVYFRYEFYE